jgi:hypothetical protein
VDVDELARALRQLASSIGAVADALVPQPSPQDVRTQALLLEWGDRGLDRAEVRALFVRHGFAPQAVGGWARGSWIEERADGLRYASELSRQWLADRGGGDDTG